MFEEKDLKEGGIKEPNEERKEERGDGRGGNEGGRGEGGKEEKQRWVKTPDIS